MSKILITGGSGLLGKTISKLLLQKKHEVIWLSRTSGEWQGIKKFEWHPDKGQIDKKALVGVDHIIHLAGEGIFDKRWTNAYKKKLLDSRVQGLDLLYKTITEKNVQIKSLIGASAIGYYGFSESERLYTENDGATHGFLPELCVKWENAYLPFEKLGVRTAVLRIGNVLSQKGGYYARVVPIFKLGLGSVFGSGKAYLSWIHIFDLAALFLYLIEKPELNGTYNAVSSEPITLMDFSKKLAKHLNRPLFFKKLPTLLPKIVFGERAELVYHGSRVSNAKILAAGFRFEYDDLKSALDALAD